MKTLVLSMISIAATVAAMTACTSESDPIDEIKTDVKLPIEFQSSILGVETKSIKGGNQFINDDKIALYGYKKEVPTANYTENIFLTNKTYTYNNDGFTTTDAYWERGATHYFYAYYPVATTTASSTGYVLTEATENAAPSVKVVCKENVGIDDDLLWAEPTSNGIAFTGASISNVTLPFEHKLSRVSFLVKLEDNKVPTSSLSKITFDVDKNEGSLNIITGALTETSGTIHLSKTLSAATNITTAGINGEDFSPMILPGSTISNLKVTINGQELAVTLGTTPALASGKITTITITVKSSSISMDSNITEWTAGGTPGEGTVQ